LLARTAQKLHSCASGHRAAPYHRLISEDRIMRDEYDDRLWNDGREHANRSIDALLAGIMQAFRALHRVQWASPWTDSPSPDRRCRS
jgi:hypothetical protein